MAITQLKYDSIEYIDVVCHSAIMLCAALITKLQLQFQMNLFNIQDPFYQAQYESWHKTDGNSEQNNKKHHNCPTCNKTPQSPNGGVKHDTHSDTKPMVSGPPGHVTSRDNPQTLLTHSLFALFLIAFHLTIPHLPSFSAGPLK